MYWIKSWEPILQVYNPQSEKFSGPLQLLQLNGQTILWKEHPWNYAFFSIWPNGKNMSPSPRFHWNCRGPNVPSKNSTFLG